MTVSRFRMAAFAVALVVFSPAGNGQEIRVPPGLTDKFPSRCTLSADGKVLYVPEPKGRFAAVNVMTGKSSWVSAESAKPLATTKDAVFALINEKPGVVRFAAFDPTSGKIAKKSDSFTLPAPEADLVIEAGTAGKKGFYVKMDAKGDVKGKQPIAKKFLGTLYFDPSTGNTELSKEQAGSLGIARPNPATKLERPKGLPASFSRTYAPFVGQKNIAQIYYGSDAMTAWVYAVQWDKTTGKYLATKEIFLNRNGNALGLIFDVANGEFVVHRPTSGQAGFYSAETGDRIFTVPKGMQFAWWKMGSVVVGIQNPAAGVTDTSLKAVDLATGKLIWTQVCDPLVGR